MNDFRPLLYFLKECEHTRDVCVDNEFISTEDLEILDGVSHIPRTADYIWIYQKLTEYCKNINEKYFQFQISGLGTDLHVHVSSDWILSIDRGQASTNKFNIIIFRSSGSLDMNHGEYSIPGDRGNIMIFPSYLWWKASGDILVCTLSGDHFR
jgi:hypothetical protein